MAILREMFSRPVYDGAGPGEVSLAQADVQGPDGSPVPFDKDAGGHGSNPRGHDEGHLTDELRAVHARKAMEWEDLVRRTEAAIAEEIKDGVDPNDPHLVTGRQLLAQAKMHAMERRRLANSPTGYARPTWYESKHAPKGGVTIGGTFYPGGKFIPGEVLAAASPEERAAVESGEARQKPLAPAAGPKPATPAGVRALIKKLGLPMSGKQTTTERGPGSMIGQLTTGKSRGFEVKKSLFDKDEVEVNFRGSPYESQQARERAALDSLKSALKDAGYEVKHYKTSTGAENPYNFTVKAPPPGGLQSAQQPGGPKAPDVQGPTGEAPAPPSPIQAEPRTPPPPGPVYAPDPGAVNPHTGLAEFSRVGVPAHSLPPPPAIHRLPNLTPQERKVEHEFASAFEADPDGMAAKFVDIAVKAAKGGPVTFGTDDCKVLSPRWESPLLAPEQRAANRAQFNTALHQTANALAKRAFVMHLNTLKPGDEILVTAGGCGAGKGYALKSIPQMLEVKNGSKAVWDSAGDQNATENAWVQAEAEKRGLKVNYVFVHIDPYDQWSNPNRGVVKRAADPNDGRMVDAKVFADSYAYGAKNHAAFQRAMHGNPNARFFYIRNGSPPKEELGMPEDALTVDPDDLYRYALKTVREVDTAPHIKRGATAGERIWGSQS